MATRILYFINGFERGGAELGLLRLVREGVFEGCDLTVASLIGGDPDLIADFRREGVRLIILSDQTKMSPAHMASGALRLFALARAERPDILVLSLPQANIVGRIAGRLAGVSRIVSFEHNTKLARPAYERLFRMTSGCVSEIWADSEETLRVAGTRFYQRAPSSQRVVPLVSLSADTTEASPRSGDAFRMVSVGRLTTTKNHQAAIRAVAALRAKDVDVFLDIFGEGEMRESLIALSKALGVSDLIVLRGFQYAWWTAGRYDAFLLTSLHEGLCIVALEAMAAGLPVIAPMIGGLRDYAKGAICELPSSPAAEEIAAAIEQLRSDADLRRSLALRGRSAALDSHGAVAVKQVYRQLNAELCAASR